MGNSPGQMPRTGPRRIAVRPVPTEGASEAFIATINAVLRRRHQLMEALEQWEIDRQEGLPFDGYRLRQIVRRATGLAKWEAAYEKLRTELFGGIVPGRDEAAKRIRPTFPHVIPDTEGAWQGSWEPEPLPLMPTPYLQPDREGRKR
jgi:hypothetical protein